jgi:hypothetical protein
MSEPILPLRQWPAGIQQASVPANDNALRLEALSRPALGIADNETTGSLDGDVWIVGGAPDGAFASFDENDIALYHVDPVSDIGGWHAWAPVEGVRLVVNDVRKVYAGTAGWIDDPSITGGGGGVQSVVAGTNVTVDATDPANPIVSAAGAGSSLVDVITPTNSSGTVTLDFASKSKYAGAITLGANVTTLAFSNLPGAGKYAEYELHITQDGTGSRTFAIPASHKALGGSDTAVAAASGAVTVLTASTVDNGTTWRYAMQESA